MATYREIIALLKTRGVRGVAPCHIAHVKDYHRINRGPAPNRQFGEERAKPCPSSKWGAIEEALRHFGMIQ